MQLEVIIQSDEEDKELARGLIEGLIIKRQAKQPQHATRANEDRRQGQAQVAQLRALLNERRAADAALCKFAALFLLGWIRPGVFASA